MKKPSEIAYLVDALLYEFYGKSMANATEKQIVNVALVIKTLNEE